MHSHAFGEVMIPASAHRQLAALVSQGKVSVVNETELDPKQRIVYDMVYNQLVKVMIDPREPNKNKGETCSPAYAKVKSISIFATDESNLQPIIDSQLNTGINNIYCLRIVDIIILRGISCFLHKSKQEFEQNVTTGEFEDYGGERWVVLGD